MRVQSGDLKQHKTISAATIQVNSIAMGARLTPKTYFEKVAW